MERVGEGDICVPGRRRHQTSGHARRFPLNAAKTLKIRSDINALPLLVGKKALGRQLRKGRRRWHRNNRVSDAGRMSGAGSAGPTGGPALSRQHAAPRRAPPRGEGRPLIEGPAVYSPGELRLINDSADRAGMAR